MLQFTTCYWLFTIFNTPVLWMFHRESSIDFARDGSNSVDIIACYSYGRECLAISLIVVGYNRVAVNHIHRVFTLHLLYGMRSHSNRIIDVSNSHPCPSSRIDICASEAPPHSSDWMGRCCSPQPTGTVSVLAYCSHRHAKCTLRVHSHLSPQWLAWSACQTWWTVAREFIVVHGGNHEANVHSTLAIAENPISK